MNDWLVYLLRCNDNTLYCGITNDIDKRVEAHNKASGAKYTRSRTPVTLLGVKNCATKSQALKLELQIKKMSKIEKIMFFREAIK